MFGKAQNVTVPKMPTGTSNPQSQAGAPAQAGPVTKAMPIPSNSDHEPDASPPEQPPKQPNPKNPNRAKTVQVVEVAPIAKPARLRPRHWGLILSFLILVVLPVAGTGWYLWSRAIDQYASNIGFTVRQEGGASATDSLGGFAAELAGASPQSDTDILYQFIQSQEMVDKVDAVLDLRAHYGANWRRDPVFSLHPEATFEDLVQYWDRIVRISYDQSSHLIKLRVLAFEPDVAQSLAEEILLQSQSMINALNATARNDSIRYAELDLGTAEERLKAAREALILFRTLNQTVDPLTDLAGRLTVVNTLQQQLAEALISLDLLGGNTNATDPRIVQATRRITVIRNRIAQERTSVSSGNDSVTGKDYPTLLADYERLIVDREFAEGSYRAALAALDIARANAARQSSYLAAFVHPTLPRTPEFPQRWVLFGLTGFFLLFGWAIMALVYYSVRDSR